MDTIDEYTDLADEALPDIPEHEQPPHEQFRLAANEWVKLDDVARLLEETKTSTLAQHINNYMAENGDCAHNKAERAVKGSNDWIDHLKTIVDAKTQANYARVQMQYLQMRFHRWQTLNANNRAERRF